MLDMLTNIAKEDGEEHFSINCQSCHFRKLHMNLRGKKMKKRKSISVVICLLTVLFLLDSSYAALIDNLDGTVTQIRNDSSVLMWLKDANTAATSGYCSTWGYCLTSNGMMTWDQVNTWTNTLNSSNYLGYNDWRLPATLPVNGTSYNWDWSYDGSTDRGWNITSPNSEMSYMFYVELGNLGECDTFGNCSPSRQGLQNSGPFVNIVNINRHDLAVFDGWYWSGTNVSPPPYDAVGFNFGIGGRQYGGYYPGDGDYGWAVRNTGTLVPEPSTFLLVGSGLISLAGLRKKFKK